MAYSYNPQSGKWSHSPTPAAKPSSSSGGSKSSGGGGSSAPAVSGGEDLDVGGSALQSVGSNLKASTGDKDSSQGASEKKYNEIEYTSLEGQLSYIVTETTIKLKAGDTVTLAGIGKYLSGNYYVKSVTHNIGSSGYSHSAVVIKTDFGKTLKSSSTTSQAKDGGEGAKKEETKVAPTPQSSTTPKRTYTVKKGDCLWNIAKKELGSGSDWRKIYDANTGQLTNPDLIYPGQQLVIP